MSVYKALEVIYHKTLLATPKMLQRMLLHLQKYEPEIHLKQDQKMYLADTLSRARESVLLPPTNADCEEVCQPV